MPKPSWYNGFDKQTLDHWITSLNLMYRLGPLQDSPGFVYLVRCGDFHKIGRTTNLAKRFYQLQTANPIELTLVDSVEVMDAGKLESLLHLTMTHFRGKGEWFELDDDLLYVIQGVFKTDLTKMNHG